MKSLFFGSTPQAPTPSRLNLKPEEVTIYSPDATNIPRDLAALRDRCVETLQLKNPPSIAIVKDMAWAYHWRYSDAGGVASADTQTVLIPEHMANKLGNNDVFARYVFCHEMGHLKQFEELEHTKFNRRTLLAGAAISTIAGGWAGKAMGEAATSHVTDTQSTQSKIGWAAALAGGATGFFMPHVLVHHWQKLLDRPAEFYADRMAVKVLGTSVVMEALMQQCTEYLKPVEPLLRGLPLPLAEVWKVMGFDATRTLIEQRYGTLLKTGDSDTLAKWAILRKIDFKDNKELAALASEKGAAPAFTDRAFYMLETAIKTKAASLPGR